MKIKKESIDVVLIQEPWVLNNTVKGIGLSTGKLIYSNLHKPRAAIVLNSRLKVTPLHQFISRDVVAVTLLTGLEGKAREIVVASAYFPSDLAEVPPAEVSSLISYCKERSIELILGCDANAHHTAWGSSNINQRGEYLLEYLVNNNLTSLNYGTNPTFINAIREEVIDLTLTSAFISTKIGNWRVSNDISFSDHRYIEFRLESVLPRTECCRIPSLTNWTQYKATLEGEMPILGNIENTEELESASNQLHSAVITAFEKSCPIRSRKTNRLVPWWNKELANLRKQARRLFNKAKFNGKWEDYKMALSRYNKELRKSKRRSWGQFCEGIEELPECSRLQKALAKEHANGIGSLKKSDGTYADCSKDIVNVLTNTHFPGCVILEEEDLMDEAVILPEDRNASRAKSCASRIVTYNRVKWAIESFKPFKAPGPDGIFPALLQQGDSLLLLSLVKIFRASFSLGYIPRAWRNVRVVFIPKAGKRSSSDPKAYRPISLSSFLLKTMEKVVDLHIRGDALMQNPLHQNQFAYQAGKSTISALHNIIGQIESVFENKEIALCAFLDIEGAFDNTSFSSIERAALAKGIDPITIKWIGAMLADRRIISSHGDESVTIRTSSFVVYSD